MSFPIVLAVNAVKGSYDLCKTIQYNSADADQTLRRLERHQVLLDDLMRENGGIVMPAEYTAVFDEIQISLKRVQKQVQKSRDASVAMKAWKKEDFKRMIAESDAIVHELRFQQTTNHHRIQQQALGTLQNVQAEVQGQTSEILIRTQMLERELREVHRMLQGQLAFRAPLQTQEEENQYGSQVVEPAPSIAPSLSARRSLFRRFSTKAPSIKEPAPAESIKSTPIPEEVEEAQALDAELSQDLQRLGISAPSMFSSSLERSDSQTVRVRPNMDLQTLDSGVAAVKRAKTILQRRSMMPQRSNSYASSSSIATSPISSSPSSSILSPLSPPVISSTGEASLSSALSKIQTKQAERKALADNLKKAGPPRRPSLPVLPGPTPQVKPTRQTTLPTLPVPSTSTLPPPPPPPPPGEISLKRLQKLAVDDSNTSYTCMSSSPDGRFLVIGGSRYDPQHNRGGFIALYAATPECETLIRIAWLGLDHAVSSLAWSSDGSIIGCGLEGMMVDLYRTKGLKMTPSEPLNIVPKSELRRVARLAFDTEIATIYIPNGTKLDRGNIVITSHFPGEKTLLFHRYWWKTAGMWSMETTLEEDKASRYTIKCESHDEPIVGSQLKYVISHRGTVLQIPGRAAIPLRDRDVRLQHVVAVAGGTKLLFLSPLFPQNAMFQLYDSHTGAHVTTTSSMAFTTCEHPLYGCYPIDFGKMQPIAYSSDGLYGVQASEAGLVLRDGQASPIEAPLARISWEDSTAWDSPVRSDRNHVQLMLGGVR